MMRMIIHSDNVNTGSDGRHTAKCKNATKKPHQCYSNVKKITATYMLKYHSSQTVRPSLLSGKNKKMKPDMERNFCLVK